MNIQSPAVRTRLLAAVIVLVIVAGVRQSYNRYRGTGLSRVPGLTSSRLEAADYQDEASLSPIPETTAVAGIGFDGSEQTQPVSVAEPEAAASSTKNNYRNAAPVSPPYRQDNLRLYPTITKGMRTPFDLWRYYGRGVSSFASPILPMRFDQWLAFHQRQKPKLMSDVRKYMDSRFSFTEQVMDGVYMSGGKPVMRGPVAKLEEVDSYEALADMAPQAIRDQDIFPYKPLAHPLQSVAHMVFPEKWIKVHPEHRRIDVDMDFPSAYLPEFPPPMYLTTHKELGDVTNGREVTLDNYYEIFDGLLTPEQMEGLKELLRPSPTTWFNHTDHRITAKPSQGVACFDCHVNGHTNAAFELGPDSRPNMARLRVDTPTMRGNYNLMQLSSKRSIRSMDHFSEVEEYFDGDPGMQQAIGPRAVKREVTNRMADFNAILDYPPAPKLNPLMRLIPEQATKSELRGEKLFHGKAQCAKCHYGPGFVDDYMHDLRAERFYKGRPEGPIKTFPLRGIKDSPPYLHDGRCPTLHDVVEFFNLVLELKLTKQEKVDLVAYMLCL